MSKEYTLNYEGLNETPRDVLLRVFNKKNTSIFFEESDKGTTRFVPAILARFLTRIWPCKTLRDTGEIWIYNYENGDYITKGEEHLTEKIKELFDKNFTSSYVNPAIYDIKASTFIDRKDFELPINMIPVKNGIIRIPVNEDNEWEFKLLTLIDNHPDHIVVNRIPVEYDPNLDCKQFKKFLYQVFPLEDIQFLQEYVGYCLYRDFPFHKVVMLVGPHNTGKSTFIYTVNNFLGSPETNSVNCKSIPLQALNDKFQRAELYKALGNFLADLSPKSLKDSSWFKQITGRDYINARHIYKPGFSFKPYTKHIWSCNQIPYSYDDDDSFYGRWRIIKTGKKRFNPNDADTDPQLQHKLTRPDELSGILNWALEGLDRLLKQGCFTGEDNNTPDKVREIWSSLSDPLSAFMHSVWIFWNADHEVSKEDFYEHFHGYCIYNSMNPWTKDKVGKEMRKRYVKNNLILETYPLDKRTNKQVTSWKGVGIRDPEDERQSDDLFERRRETDYFG